jgi:hypothetical protein
MRGQVGRITKLRGVRLYAECSEGVCPDVWALVLPKGFITCDSMRPQNRKREHNAMTYHV